MIATGILHEASWPWNVLAWMTGFMILAIGAVAVLLLTVALRPGKTSVQRSFFAFGPAALAAPLFFVLLRAFEFVEPSFGPGPQYWLLGWIPGMSSTWVHPYDTVVSLHAIAAALTSILAIGMALLFPPKWRKAWEAPLPGRWVAAALLGTLAIAIPFVAFRVYVDDVNTARLLEWVALTPTLGLAIAIRGFARVGPKREKAQASPAPAPPKPIPDFRDAWISAGLLDANAKPLVRVHPETRSDTPSERAARAWTAAEAPGLPPRALDRLLEDAWGEPLLHLVGDLPTDTGHALWTALLADLVGARGLRVLVIHPDGAALAGAVKRALKRARTWSPGQIVLGPDALQEALAGRQMPAVTVVTLSELGQRLVRMVAAEAKPWLMGVDLILAHRPDLGNPVEVTHTAFACRRWDLASGRIARPPVLVSSPDTPPHRAFLERLFPGRETRPMPFDPRTSAETVAWPGTEPTPEAAIPWLTRAARVVTDLDYAVTAVDPAGRWGRDELPDQAVIAREATWQHHASVATFQPGSLVEAAASLPFRLPEPPVHQSLWGIPVDPVARFLHPARLAELTRTGRLPRPAPVVGTRNRFMRLIHLDVALREAPNDEASLRASFGDDLVDFRLASSSDAAMRASTYSAWRDGDRLVRSPHLQAPAGTEAMARTETITDDVVEIIEDRTGQVLLRVDARTAPTRFYPKRVFGSGNRRYRVPMHAFDAKRRKLKVELASPRDRVTIPVLSFELEQRRTTVERVTRRHKAFTMHTLTAECLVTERVHAAWVPGLDQEERFDVVETRYDTEARFVFPEKATKGLALFHLAASVQAFLPVFLRCDAADIAVTPVRAGFFPGMGAGIAVLDRFVGGMGFADALDDGAIAELLSWTRALTYECSCMEGCAKCAPAQVLRVGPDKQGLLAILEGL